MEERARLRSSGGARRGWSSSLGTTAAGGRNDDTATGFPERFARCKTASSAATQAAGASSCSGRTCSCAH
eukprot:4297047-Pleurochrysis_carterae.AAC.1